MEKSLGTVLKELRKKKKLTAKETADELLLMGYEISDKTLSGYETGIRMPNADVFMALCKIYDCKNILQVFSFVKADYSIPTDDEWEIIERYRLLDPHGKKMVDFTLNEEWGRSTAEQKHENEVVSMMSKDDSRYVNAAHADNYTSAPEELKQLEEDMINKKFLGG